MKKRTKKGQMSINMFITIVLAVVGLILGVVLVRQVMCSAVGFTGDIDEKVRGEINQLFGGTRGGEVICIGAGDPIKMVPGETNNVICSIRAEEESEYEIKVVEIVSDSAQLSEERVRGWFFADVDTWKQTIAPNDHEPKKVFRLNIPDNAPEKRMVLITEIRRDGNLISTQDLDFEISSLGLVRNTIC